MCREDEQCLWSNVSTCKNIQGVFTFLGSMMPQYMALSVSSVSSVCQKIFFGHFEARYEVEIRYADCSHKYKIN